MHCISRISYLYGFHGMSTSVDTACSSSLVAAHLAVSSIQGGSAASTGSAVVGGTGMLLCPDSTAMFQVVALIYIKKKPSTIE
jgi:acyl transferase domain-containing protein